MLSRELALRWSASGEATIISIIRNVTLSSPSPCTPEEFLRPGPLQTILFQAGITADEFQALL